jgi:hypothetical protein
MGIADSFPRCYVKRERAASPAASKRGREFASVFPPLPSTPRWEAAD